MAWFLLATYHKLIFDPVRTCLIQLIVFTTFRQLIVNLIGYTYLRKLLMWCYFFVWKGASLGWCIDIVVGIADQHRCQKLWIIRPKCNCFTRRVLRCHYTVQNYDVYFEDFQLPKSRCHPRTTIVTTLNNDMKCVLTKDNSLTRIHLNLLTTRKDVEKICWSLTIGSCGKTLQTKFTVSLKRICLYRP